MRAIADDDPPPAGAGREGAGRGHPPARRAGQPRPRAVPDHGRVRSRLQRRAAAAGDRRRHPTESGLPSDAAGYQALAGGGLHISAVVRGRGRPRRTGLADGTTDVVVVAPPDAEAQFRAGKQSVIEVVVDTVDPLRANYAGFLAANLANGVNQTIIRRAVEEAEG